VTIDVLPIANDLARWLQSRAGVTDVRPPIMAPKQPTRRFPLPVPVPAFLLPGGKGPAFEISFTYKGEPRTFRYFIEAPDDPATIGQTLRVHTNGELIVRVPDEYGHLMPNDIYYDNRSAAAQGMGSAAPPL
jgi:hypothetical protein